jgi:hypothetical protein
MDSFPQRTFLAQENGANLSAKLGLEAAAFQTPARVASIVARES